MASHLILSLGIYDMSLSGGHVWDMFGTFPTKSLLTNITSPASHTNLFRSMICISPDTILFFMTSGFLHVVFPLIPARSGPKMVLACLMASGVILQCGRWFQRTICVNLPSLGLPTMDRAWLTSCALLICRLVYPLVLPLMVFIRHSAALLFFWLIYGSGCVDHKFPVGARRVVWDLVLLFQVCEQVDVGYCHGV